MSVTYVMNGWRDAHRVVSGEIHRVNVITPVH